MWQIILYNSFSTVGFFVSNENAADISFEKTNVVTAEEKGKK